MPYNYNQAIKALNAQHYTITETHDYLIVVKNGLIIYPPRHEGKSLTQLLTEPDFIRKATPTEPPPRPAQTKPTKPDPESLLDPGVRVLLERNRLGLPLDIDPYNPNNDPLPPYTPNTPPTNDD